MAAQPQGEEKTQIVADKVDLLKTAATEPRKMELDSQKTGTQNNWKEFLDKLQETK